MNQEPQIASNTAIKSPGDFIYKQEPESDIICMLCEGSHGNNTQCQRND